MRRRKDLGSYFNYDVADLKSDNTLADERLHEDGLDDAMFAWPEPSCEITEAICTIWTDLDG